MTSRRRVLMLAPYFLPRRRVGSMRPFRFAIHLKEFGWEPTILTIAAAGQELTPKEAHLLRDIRILNLEAPFDRTRGSESQLGAAPGRNGRSAGGLLTSVVDIVDRQLPIDSWLVLFAARYRTIARWIEEVDPHVIWATGDPWSGLVAGRWLSMHLDRPYVADFRDPWTLSEVRADGQWMLSRLIDRSSERRVIASADVVMFQAECVEAAYRQHYARLAPTTITIRNSFDLDVFDDPIGAEGGRPAKRTRSLHLGFFGRFRAMSPATLIADVLAEMRKRHGAKAERVYVHSFGPLSDDDARYARARDVAAQFISHDAVPLQRSLSALRQFDILLVSTEQRRNRIIPAKLFEYLAAGRPILSLSRNPEVAGILERTQTGLQLVEKHAVADMLAACVDAIDGGRPLPIPFDPKSDEIMKHEARATTRELARVLDAIVDHGSIVFSPPAG